MFDFFRHCYRLILPALLVMLVSCGNKARQMDSYIYEDRPSVDETTSPEANEADEEEIEAPSAPTAPAAPSRPSSNSNSSSSDNMRGFDPASEDDMDDNGMSRYMESYDDEGWD